jgi:hypothetical protein
VRICSVCVVRVAKRAAACSADDFDAKSTHVGERVCVRVCAHVQCLHV